MSKESTKDRRVLIEVLRCRAHNVSALCIEGRRVTGKKCCGSWSVQERFVVRARDVIEALKEET